MALPNEVSSLLIGAAANQGPYQIEDSLRFRGSQNLFRDYGSAPTGVHDDTNCYMSMWVKLADNTVTTNSGLFCWQLAAVNNGAVTQVSAGDWVNNKSSQVFSRAISSTLNDNTRWTPLLRDPAAWYHLFFSYVGTGSNLCTKTLYINGQQASTDFNTATNYNLFRYFSVGSILNDGGNLTRLLQFDGYLANIHFCQFRDASTVAVTDFGEYDENGVWVPKEYTGAYGTNGFYLDFSEPSSIGADRSGNGNDFTATGFDFTEANGYSGSDLTPDSPTNNQFTNYNPRTAGTVTTTLGPWFWSRDTSAWNAQVPQGLLPKSGKWWVEFGCVWGGASTESIAIGFVKTKEATTKSINTIPGFTTGYGWLNPNITSSLWYDHSVSTPIAPSISVAPGNRYKLGLAIDCDQATPTVQLWQNAVNDFADTAGWTKEGDVTMDRALVDAGLVLTTSIYYGNTGPRFFSTNPTTDAAGYKVFLSQDLPAVAITNPSDYFTTILDTGANILTAAQAAFSNGLWWIKDRANSNEHQFVDSLRGGNLALVCPAYQAETAYIAPAGNSVAWCWNAPEVFDPLPTSSGMTAAAGRRNLDAGFSIVTYTPGPYVAGSMRIGTGFSQPAEFVLIQNRALPSGGYNQSWFAYHHSITSPSPFNVGNFGWNDSQGGTLALNSSAAAFTYGPDPQTVGNGENYVMYAWHSVPGYSSIGSYVGNGNADGPFVYTGFRPAWVMIKRTDGVGPWRIADIVRSPYNPAIQYLFASHDNVDTAQAGQETDFLSNGFKVRATLDSQNASGGTYVYLAFAEHPFGGSNVSPSPAR